MSDDGRLFTCEICGEGKMSDVAMQTHMHEAHVYNEISCMFCDLGGISVEEMTLHINSVHCSDSSFDEGNASRNDLQWLSVQQNTENQAAENCAHEAFMHLGNTESGQTLLPDANGVSFASNYTAQTRGQQSPGHMCKMNGDKQNKGKLSDTVIRSSSCSKQDKIDSPAVCFSSCNDAKVTSQHNTSLSQRSVNTSKSLPQMTLANGIDQKTFRSDRDPAQSHVSSGEYLPLMCHVCPVCNQVMENADLLQLHVDAHFDEELQPSNHALILIAATTVISNTTAATSQRKSSTSSALIQNDRSTRSIHPSLIDDERVCTHGIIERVQQIPSYREVRQRYVCSPMSHYESQNNNCGFRNLQMLLSCLIRDATYLCHVFSGRALMPSVNMLQQLIEKAWAAGFDEAGRQQLRGKVVGTRKWIGATEIYAVLSFLHVRCEIVDFHKPTGNNNTHPRLMQWVKDYFQKGQGKFLPPLYFQHQGHSRTIVGIEDMADGSLILLVFDPSCHQMKRFPTSTKVESLMHLVRKDINSLTASQYQILSVHGVTSDEQDYNRRKVVQSTRIP